MVLPASQPTKSYWIEAANSPLRDFQSSDGLPDKTDIVIVGSGYAGASTAYWISKYTEHAEKRPHVTLLEARDMCGGATGRNGGQLRPHAYSRYPLWSEHFGADGAMELIRHEMAHLPAFEQLAREESIAAEIALQFGETFDAAMTEEAWTRLKGAYEAMRSDHGDENDVVKLCRLIEDPSEAEDFSQMKGAQAAVVHPAGQVYAYKFVHALLRIVLERGMLNLQAHTPVMSVSSRDSDGLISVKTERGTVRTKVVIHTTNRWASHLLPEFGKLILPVKGTVAAIKAPEGFIKHTGAQHWDSVVNNYHLQLPSPYNMIILGGARPFLVHRPDATQFRDDDDLQIEGVPEFLRSWPESDVHGWDEAQPTELGKNVNDGGCWTGVETNSADMFPFIGSVPHKKGHWIAAGFAGHGMPRILLSTAHIVPEVLSSLDFENQQPAIAAPFPPLPKPFVVTEERVKRLQSTDLATRAQAYRESCMASSKKAFCRTERSMWKVGSHTSVST